jgi:hypothetical protein
MPKKTKAQSIAEYRKKHYAQVNLLLPVNAKADLQSYAKAHNFQSLTALICYCLEKETGISCKLENTLPWLKKD